MVSSYILRIASFVRFRLLPRQRLFYFVNFGESRVQIMKDMLMTLYATSR